MASPEKLKRKAEVTWDILMELQPDDPRRPDFLEFAIKMEVENEKRFKDADGQPVSSAAAPANADVPSLAHQVGENRAEQVGERDALAQALAREQQQRAEREAALARAEEALAREQQQRAEREAALAQAQEALAQEKRERETLLLRHLAAAASIVPSVELKVGQLTGHEDAISGLAVAADGRHAVSVGSADDLLRVWDLARGEEIAAVCSGHTSEVQDLALSAGLPGGRHFALTASDDHTLRLWAIVLHGAAAGPASSQPAAAAAASSSLTCVATLEGHNGTVQCVAMTPNATWAVSGGGGDFEVKVWSLAGVVRSAGCGSSSSSAAPPKLSPVRSLKGHSHSVDAVALTADGSIAVSGGRDKSVRVWQLATGQCTDVLALTCFVDSLTITPDARNFIAGGSDYSVMLWELSRAGTAQHVRTLKEHLDNVVDLAVTRDGQRIVSASHDGTLRVWELSSGRCLRTLEGHSKEVSRVALTPDSRYAVSGSWDSSLRVWRL